MKWTKQPPTEPGWYCFRKSKRSKGFEVAYTRGPYKAGPLKGQLRQRGFLAGMPWDAFRHPEQFEWAGPIPEPEEPQ